MCCLVHPPLFTGMADPIYTDLQSYGTIHIPDPEARENNEKSSRFDKKWCLVPLIILILIIGVCAWTWTIKSANNHTYYENENNHQLTPIDQSTIDEITDRLDQDPSSN